MNVTFVMQCFRCQQSNVFFRMKACNKQNTFTQPIWLIIKVLQVGGIRCKIGHVLSSGLSKKEPRDTQCDTQNANSLECSVGKIMLDNSNLTIRAQDLLWAYSSDMITMDTEYQQQLIRIISYMLEIFHLHNLIYVVNHTTTTIKPKIKSFWLNPILPILMCWEMTNDSWHIPSRKIAIKKAWNTCFIFPHC